MKRNNIDRDRIDQAILAILQAQKTITEAVLIIREANDFPDLQTPAESAPIINGRGIVTARIVGKDGGVVEKDFYGDDCDKIGQEIEKWAIDVVRGLDPEGSNDFEVKIKWR